MIFHDDCYIREKPQICPALIEKPQYRIMQDGYLEVDPAKIPLAEMLDDVPNSMKPRYFEVRGLARIGSCSAACV
jgi:hypothetical protein